MKQKKVIVKSGPNRLTSVYYNMLVELTGKVVEDNNEEKIRQKVVLCIFLAINLIETFLNSYLRILAEELKDMVIKNRILREIDEEGLEWKVKNWPGVLNKKLDLSQGIGQRFVTLKNLRNDLVHYKPTYESVKTFDGEIRGLTDTGIYDGLNKDVALECLIVVEDFIGEIIFTISGIEKDQIKHHLHSWLGKVPQI